VAPPVTFHARQAKPGGYETFRVPSPKSKILDGVAWLAASHGSTLEDEVVVVIIIRIWVATIGLSYGFRQESRLQSGSPSDLRTLDNEQVGLSSPWIWQNRNPHVRKSVAVLGK
jgi:hypothetical protein